MFIYKSQISGERLHDHWSSGYIYTLFLECFSVLFVKIRCELSEIRGADRLFFEMCGHDVQQLSP